MLSIMAKIVIGFLLVGVLGVWMFLGFSDYVVFMLSPFLAPFVVPWAACTQERLADRAAAELGYGVLLAEVFTGREFERAQQWQAALRRTLRGRNSRIRRAFGTKARRDACVCTAESLDHV